MCIFSRLKINKIFLFIWTFNFKIQVHLLNVFSPLGRIKLKKKKINVPLANDNIRRADFHMISWYFVICNILFLLLKLSHLAGPKERANCPIESKFHLTEMALNSDVQLWNQTCVQVPAPPPLPFLIGWLCALKQVASPL